MAADSTLLGAAGEFHVMSELLRRGYLAGLPPHGVPNADIVVSDVGCEVMCTIQVKARRARGADGGWHMKEKHETLRSPNLFYCFVDFGSSAEDRPVVYVVPSAVVADAVATSHQVWLTTPGKYGQQHKDNNVRRFLPDYEKVF